MGKSDFILKSVLPYLVVIEGILEDVSSVAEQKGGKNKTHTQSRAQNIFSFSVFVKSRDIVLVCEPCA